MLDRLLNRKNIDLVTTLTPIIAVVLDSIFSHLQARELTVHDALMWIVVTSLGFLQTKDKA